MALSENHTILKLPYCVNYYTVYYQSGNDASTNALHEVLESYIGAIDSPEAKSPKNRFNEAKNKEAYDNAHQKASYLDPQFKERPLVSIYFKAGRGVSCKLPTIYIKNYGTR